MYDSTAVLNKQCIAIKMNISTGFLQTSRHWCC